MLRKSREENLAQRKHRKDFSGHVRDDGVHTDDHKEKRPTTIALHIDQPIKQRQQQEAPTAGPKHHGTCPNMFDDGKYKTPKPSSEQATKTGYRQILCFARTRK